MYSQFTHGKFEITFFSEVFLKIGERNPCNKISKCLFCFGGQSAPRQHIRQLFVLQRFCIVVLHNDVFQTHITTLVSA